MKASEEPLVRPTLLALVAPRRLLPVLALSSTLVVAQRAYSREPRAALVGVALCVAFVLVSPLAFRVLFPEGLELRHGAVRLLIYAALSVFVVHLVGVDVPSWFGVGPTFLTARTSVPIDVALFMVGGWGLGRDIGLEASLARARAHAAALRRDAEHAQLLALRAQLDPHFLFNTLNALQTLMSDRKVAQAKQMVLSLADFLRYSLALSPDEKVSLGEEVEAQAAYLAIEQARFGKRLVVDFDVSKAAVGARVPSLILQPLVENAVKYAVAPSRDPVTIRIVAETVGGCLRIRVTDDGKAAGAAPPSLGLGLENVRRRLDLATEGRAEFACGPVDPAGFAVVMTLPLEFA